MNAEPETPPGFQEGYRFDRSFNQVGVVMFGVFFIGAIVIDRLHRVQAIDTVPLLVGTVVAVLVLKLTRELIYMVSLSVMNLSPRLSSELLGVVPTADLVERRKLTVAMVVPFILLSVSMLGLYVWWDDVLLKVVIGFALAVNCALSVEDAVLILRQLSLPDGALLSFDLTDDSLSVWVFEPV